MYLRFNKSRGMNTFCFGFRGKTYLQWIYITNFWSRKFWKKKFFLIAVSIVQLRHLYFCICQSVFNNKSSIFHSNDLGGDKGLVLLDSFDFFLLRNYRCGEGNNICLPLELLDYKRNAPTSHMISSQINVLLQA